VRRLSGFYAVFAIVVSKQKTLLSDPVIKSTFFMAGNFEFTTQILETGVKEKEIHKIEAVFKKLTLVRNLKSLDCV
jgi:hypothetical protein